MPAPKKAGSRPASGPRCRRCWRARISCSASKRPAVPRAPGRDLSHQRRGAGLALVVLLVGRASGPGTGGIGQPRQALRSGRPARRRPDACWRDPRSETLATRFAAQWLRLQDIDLGSARCVLVPEFRFAARRCDAPRDRAVLRQPGARRPQHARSVRRPTTRSSTSGWRGTTASRTWPAIAFRRVKYVTDERRGLLGHGSILRADVAGEPHLSRAEGQVGHGGAAWDAPPPPPPPDVPDLDETAAVKDGRLLTTRERMEIHRSNPTCNACHRFMDPAGPRARQLRRHRQVAHPRERRAARHARRDVGRNAGETRRRIFARRSLELPIPLVRDFTENLMAYALGRRSSPTTCRRSARSRSQAAANDYRMSSFILGVVNSPAFQMQKPESRRAVRRMHGFSGRTLKGAALMAFITGKHIPRRTFLRERWGRRRWRCRSWRRWSAAGRSRRRRWPAERTRLVCIEMVHGAAGCNAWGATQNLWSPAAAGPRFRPGPDSARAARAVPRLPDDRQQHRRADGRSVRARPRLAATTSVRARYF